MEQCDFLNLVQQQFGYLDVCTYAVASCSVVCSEGLGISAELI